MRVIHFDAAAGRVTLNFMFLPTFIGQNPIIQKELQKELAKMFAGKTVTPGLLDEVHTWIIQWLQNKFQIAGLEKYLQAIEEVQDAGTI
jgi:hypothetical protein